MKRDEQQPGTKEGAGPAPLREQLQALVKEHGEEEVTEALMTILEKHFRRQELQAAAKKLNLMPHTAEAVKTNNN